MEPGDDADAMGRVTARVAGATVVALALGSLVFEVALARTDVTGLVARFGLYRLTAAIAFGVPGAVLANARPRNVLGWLWLGVGALHAVSVFAEGWGLAVAWHQWELPAGGWMLWIGEWASAPTYWLVPTILLLVFPDGRLPGRRWRPVAAGGVVASVLFGLGWMLLDIEDSDITTHPRGYVSPAPTWSGAPVFLAAAMVIGAVAAACSIASLVVRLRRSHDAERAQVKWVLVGGAATIVALAVALASPAPADGWIIAASTIPLPASVAIAVFQHRLWDVDLVISRSLVWTALSAGVLGIYVVVVLVLGGALGRTTGAPLLATALVAVSVQPARSRVERIANRLVYGYRDDPYSMLRALGDRLQAAADADHTVPDAVESLARALRVRYVAVEAGDRVIAAGEPGAAAGERFPLVYASEPVGVLVVAPRPDEPLTAETRRTLEDVARQLTIVVHAQQLTDDLRRSRERLVLAREEERRRLQRELHDGLGPTLAAMALQVDRGRQLAPTAPDEADRVLALLSTRIRDAVADVRSIVEDLRVPEVDDLGLAAALGEVCARFRAGGLAVTFDADDVTDLPAATEIAVYRIVSEALTNAVRHAAPSRCDVVLRRYDGVVEASVRDDGHGIDPDADRGIGITSMHERAAELGGTLELVSGAHGTTVRAQLPIGARR